MGIDKIGYNLLARYLAEQCTAREQKEIEVWANEHPRNRQKLEQFRQIWLATAERKYILKDLFSVDEQWDELKRRLAGDGERKPAKPAWEYRYSLESHSSGIHSVTQKAVRVAAIFIVAGLIGALAYQNWYQSARARQEPALRKVSTASAQRVNLTLGDGSRVMLNAGSTMEFPNRFAGEVREVFLEGEAYFDVARRPDQPFIIHSRGAVIKVLGTSFSIRSYPEDEQVQVVVRDGRVSFEIEDNEQVHPTLLTTEEIGRYHLQDEIISKAKVQDPELYFSWRKGYLKFRETRMQDVAKALERRYGITVRFRDEVIQHRKLTAFLKSRSIRNVLDVIAMSLDVEYQLKEDQILLFNR